MSSKILSAAVVGLDAYIVQVEAANTFGLSNFQIVGLPDASIREARERVHAALKFSGFKFPRGKVAVNLAPAHIKKQGPGYDLPVALALISVIDTLPPDQLKDSLFVGELALDGSVRPVGCVLLVALAAKAAGIKNIYVPQENIPEASVVSGINIYPVKTLLQLVQHLRGEAEIKQTTVLSHPSPANRQPKYDMSHIRGQETVKRALEVAAAGAHNVLMVGPPGSGKTMLARTLPTVLPKMTKEESLEVTKIHSVAGTLQVGSSLISERPFRSPHHTTSGVALVGGGTIPRPGEVSLAHRGVLFMDEFPEFHRSVLENLRQPLEDGVITVARASGVCEFPAKFMLVGSMNPCPCGYISEPSRQCVCTPGQVMKYRKKISGPLLDRIDIMVEVPKVDFDKLTSDEESESSKDIFARVQAARYFQLNRFQDSGITTNNEMNGQMIKRVCALDKEGKSFMKQALESMKLSARAYTRALRVARTIADLAGEAKVQISHLSEALQYRPKIEIAY